MTIIYRARYPSISNEKSAYSTSRHIAIIFMSGISTQKPILNLFQKRESKSITAAMSPRTFQHVCFNRRKKSKSNKQINPHFPPKDSSGAIKVNRGFFPVRKGTFDPERAGKPRFSSASPLDLVDSFSPAAEPVKNS